MNLLKRLLFKKEFLLGRLFLCSNQQFYLKASKIKSYKKVNTNPNPNHTFMFMTVERENCKHLFWSYQGSGY